MILHTFYSPSHKPLYDFYFKPSIQDKDLDLICDQIPQECSGVYMRDNWNVSMIRKLEFCLKLAGGKDIFVHSDCDVQFFKPIRKDVEKALEKADIAFQHDGMNYLCAGLFCAKPSENLQVLFHSAIEMVKNGVVNNDQTALNMILKSEDCPLIFDFMPDTWWTHGAESFSLYDGSVLNPPPDIVAHHANWVEGVMPKTILLEKVKRKVYGIT
jgi:hypothetical protein